MDHVIESCQCEGKQCTKCKEVLCVGNFGADKRLKSGLRADCKTCKGKKHKEWSAKNRERRNAYARERSRTDERVREVQKLYRESHREERNLVSRRFAARHREELREWQRLYRLSERGKSVREAYEEKNGEKIREEKRTYYQMNAEKIRDEKRTHYQRNAERIRERRRAYYQRNMERIREVKRAYYQRNAEKIVKRTILYRKKHPRSDKIKREKYTLSWYKRNKDKAAAIWKTYYQKNRERMNERVALWQKNNPRRHAATEAARRTRKTLAGGSYTVEEWEALKAQYNHACLCCGKQEPDIKLTADHITPVSLGGHSNIDNIQPLCRSCNSSKSTKIIDFRPKNT